MQGTSPGIACTGEQTEIADSLFVANGLVDTTSQATGNCWAGQWAGCMPSAHCAISAIAARSLRGGTVVGEHQVILAGPGERIVLGHTAEDRMIFARGAIAAALWGQGRKPGLYAMADVLGVS